MTSIAVIFPISRQFFRRLMNSFWSLGSVSISPFVMMSQNNFDQFLFKLYEASCEWEDYISLFHCLKEISVWGEEKNKSQKWILKYDETASEVMEWMMRELFLKIIDLKYFLFSNIPLALHALLDQYLINLIKNYFQLWPHHSPLSRYDKKTL